MNIASLFLHRSRLWLLAASLAAATITTNLHAQGYWFTDLSTSAPPPSDYVIGNVTGINNRGVVVGWVGNCCDTIAARITSHTLTIYASLGPAHSSWGNAINNTDAIAGWMESGGTTVHAFYVVPGDVTAPRYDLHPPFVIDPSQKSEIKKINDAGELIGIVTSGGAFPRHLCSYFGNTSGWAESLAPYLGLGSGFVATDLNNGKQIVGNAKWGGRIFHRGTHEVVLMSPYLWDDNNTADAVNDSGEVAGTVALTAGYLYSAGTATRFGSGRVQRIADINNNGDVVGTTTAVDFEGHAFLYVKSSGAFIDLNGVSGVPSTWTLVTATGINDSGQIIGMARRLATINDHVSTTYVYHAYKLTPWNWDVILTP